MPQGFNVWSAFYTNLDLRTLGKGWLNIMPSNRYYPQIFQAGTEGFMESLQGFQPSKIVIESYGKKPGSPAIASHIPMPQITEAKEAWRWLQKKGKPFYIDQLHLIKGWNILAERKAQEDAMVAGANGSPYYKEAVELPGTSAAQSPRKLVGNDKKGSARNINKRSPSSATYNGGLAETKEHDETVHELPADRPLLHSRPRPAGQRRATERSKNLAATVRPAPKLVQRHSTPLVSDQFTALDGSAQIQYDTPIFSESPSDIRGQEGMIPPKRTSNRARNIPPSLRTGSEQTFPTHPNSLSYRYTPSPTSNVTITSTGNNNATGKTAITDNVQIPKQRRSRQEQKSTPAGPEVLKLPPKTAKSQSALKGATPKAAHPKAAHPKTAHPKTAHTKAARARSAQSNNAYQSQMEPVGASQMQGNEDIQIDDSAEIQMDGEESQMEEDEGSPVEEDEGSLIGEDEDFQTGEGEEPDESAVEGEESQGEEQLDTSDMDRTDGKDSSEIDEVSGEDEVGAHTSDNDEAGCGDDATDDEHDKSRDDDDVDADNVGEDDEVDDDDDYDSLSI